MTNECHTYLFTCLVLCPLQYANTVFKLAQLKNAINNKVISALFSDAHWTVKSIWRDEAYTLHMI